jgi:GT2 family glycosyltransferase
MVELSIIVVNWNTRQLLKECLESVRNNPPECSFEMLVVDNASTDGSVEMVKGEFPEFVLIENQTNRGFAAANNQGFEVAKGRDILLLNSDTVVHGRVLENSVQYLREHAEVGAMGCRVLNTDGTVQLTCSEFPSLLNQILLASGLWKLRRPRYFGKYLMTDWQRDSEREVEVITGCYLLVRRAVIDQVGVLDEDFFFFGEETDWCLRMRRAGWQLRLAPIGTITHHGSASAKKLNHKRDVMLSGAMVRLQLKHFGVAAAVASWLIAAIFNGSRAIYWTVRAVVTPSEGASNRATHFRRVLGALGTIWPRTQKI